MKNRIWDRLPGLGRRIATGVMLPVALSLSVVLGMICLVLLFLSHNDWNVNRTVSASLAGLVGKSGTLIIAGGGNLPESIPERFRLLAGGDLARVVIIPSYDATDREERAIMKEWKQRRVSSVAVARTRTREDHASQILVEQIRSATGVWITGGQQSVTAAYYSGSKVEDELTELLDRGGVIGGTSAGAAIMSRVMIEEGRREAKTRQGLDLFRGVVVDQHFMHRNRLTRLRGVLDQHPTRIGVGVDEGTALIVNVRAGSLEVLGNSYVMLWSPSESNSPHRAEFLKDGDSFDLDEFEWQDAATEYEETERVETAAI
jgi:cyanophycinase